MPAPPQIESSEGYVKMYPPLEPTPKSIRKGLTNEYNEGEKSHLDALSISILVKNRIIPSARIDQNRDDLLTIETDSELANIVCVSIPRVTSLGLEAGIAKIKQPENLRM